MKNNLVRVFKTERNDVALFERLPFDFLAVQEDSLAVPSVLHLAGAVDGNNRSALPGNQRIGELKVIACVAATAHEKMRLRDSHGPAGPIGGHHTRERLPFAVTESGMRNYSSSKL